MFNLIYKITSPKVVEEFVDVVDNDENSVLVKVEMMAICKADIRYFLGARDQNVLNHKYPLAPIHEAVGRVIKDPTGHFKKNDKVILVPNSVNENFCIDCPNKRCERKDLGKNYCPYAEFKSSSSDGFMREFYASKPEGLVKYNKNVPNELAVFSELLSVGVSALRRIDFTNVKRIALFGDGIMAYIVYIVLVNDHPDVEVTVFGIDHNKLACFKKAKTTRYEDYHGPKFDTLIECVGGRFSEDAINSMINLSLVGADLILMGVSENNIGVNTRLVLEKGLSLKGVTRSTREDFIHVSELLNKKEVLDDLRPMVISVNTISNISDVYKVFELDIDNKTIIGKNLMKY